MPTSCPEASSCSFKSHIAPSLAALPASSAAPASPTILQHTGISGRAEAEAFIAERYALSFSARIRRFMPELYTLRSEDGSLAGACGVRLASKGTLFLEHYLDSPIEDCIRLANNVPVTRESIVEVGQFAGVSAGAFRQMIRLLTAELHRRELQWVVFTGTAALRNAFHRLSLAPVDLGPASIERLPAAEQQHWGHYYAQSPRVLFGNISLGYAVLSGARI